jgi:hypothetical protein
VSATPPIVKAFSVALTSEGKLRPQNVALYAGRVKRLLILITDMSSVDAVKEGIAFFEKGKKKSDTSYRTAWRTFCRVCRQYDLGEPAELEWVHHPLELDAYRSEIEAFVSVIEAEGSLTASTMESYTTYVRRILREVRDISDPVAVAEFIDGLDLKIKAKSQYGTAWRTFQRVCEQYGLGLKPAELRKGSRSENLDKKLESMAAQKAALARRDTTVAPAEPPAKLVEPPAKLADPLARLAGTSAISGAEAAKNAERHAARAQPYRDGARALPPTTPVLAPTKPPARPTQRVSSPHAVQNPIQAPPPPFGFSPVLLPVISTKPLPPVRPWNLDEDEDEDELEVNFPISLKPRAAPVPEVGTDAPHDPGKGIDCPERRFEPEPFEPEPEPFQPEPEGIHIPQEVVDAIQAIVYFTRATPDFLARTRWWGFQNGTGYIGAEAGYEAESPEIEIPHAYFTEIYAAADVLRAWGTNNARREAATVFPVIPLGPGSREPMPPEMIAQILAA